MACPICDQKPINCDCTAEERRQYAEIEDLEGEVDRLRAERQWIPVSERLPEIDQNVLACHTGEVGISHRYVDGWYWDVDEWHKPFTPTHWMPLPPPPAE